MTDTPPCATCGSLRPVEWSQSKYGSPEADRPLPPAAAALVTRCGWCSGGRGEELRQCPTCGAWFEWTLSYEYLVNGSEDEETLRRISDEEAEALRRRLAPG